VRVASERDRGLDAVAHLEPWDHGERLLVAETGGNVVLSRTYRAGFLERWGMEDEFSGKRRSPHDCI